MYKSIEGCAGVLKTVECELDGVFQRVFFHHHGFPADEFFDFGACVGVEREGEG